MGKRPLLVVAVLAMALFCDRLDAKMTGRSFQNTDELIAAVKQQRPDNLRYDTNGELFQVRLGPEFATDQNVRLLRVIKSIKYLKSVTIDCNQPTGILTLTTNGVLALAEYPNLRSLCLVCCGRESKYIGSALATLTHLESLSLVQDSYSPNDTVYLTHMTSLVALEIAGRIPQTQPELQSLADMVGLRKLHIFGSEESIQNLMTNRMPRFNRLNTLVISPDWELYGAASAWEKSAK